MHAGNYDVETSEKVVVEVEGAVLEDVHLHPGEDAERGEASVEVDKHVELLEQTVAVQAVGDGESAGVVGQHHVFVPQGDRRGGHGFDGRPTVAPCRVGVT